MSARRVIWGYGVVGLLVVVALPLAGHWWRQQAQPGCALDGQKIQPIYQVEIIDRDEQHLDRRQFELPLSLEELVNR